MSPTDNGTLPKWGQKRMNVTQRLLLALSKATRIFNEATDRLNSTSKSIGSIDRRVINNSTGNELMPRITNRKMDVYQLRYSYNVFIAFAAIVFALGLLGNLAVIGRVLRQGVLRARIRMLLLSLSCADVLLMLLEFPLNQFVWLSTVVWRSGDFTCRLSAFGRAFASYLLSYILVVISLDRCLNTVKPTAPKAASKRMKKLLWSALVFAVLCASPQWLIFQTSEIPHSTPKAEQCIQRGLVTNENVVKVVYPIFCMLFQYVIPIVLISLDYTIILHVMSRPVGQSDFQQLISFRQSPSAPASTAASAIPNSERSSSHGSYIRKAQMKTLRILLLTVAVFAACWLPYYILMLFYVCNSRLAERVVPYSVYKMTDLLAASNACINPFIYGNYLLKIKERCRSCWP